MFYEVFKFVKFDGRDEVYMEKSRESEGQRLIAINHIQNKSLFTSANIRVYCV